MDAVSALLNYARAFELWYNVKSVNETITDMVQDTTSRWYLPTHTRVSDVCYTLLAKWLIMNKDVLHMLKWLSRKHGKGKMMGTFYLECYVFYAYNDDNGLLVFEVTGYFASELIKKLLITSFHLQQCGEEHVDTHRLAII